MRALADVALWGLEAAVEGPVPRTDAGIVWPSLRIDAVLESPTALSRNKKTSSRAFIKAVLRDEPLIVYGD